MAQLYGEVTNAFHRVVWTLLITTLLLTENQPYTIFIFPQPTTLSAEMQAKKRHPDYTILEVVRVTVENKLGY